MIKVTYRLRLVLGEWTVLIYNGAAFSHSKVFDSFEEADAFAKNSGIYDADKG